MEQLDLKTMLHSAAVIRVNANSPTTVSCLEGLMTFTTLMQRRCTCSSRHVQCILLSTTTRACLGRIDKRSYVIPLSKALVERLR